MTVPEHIVVGYGGEKTGLHIARDGTALSGLLSVGYTRDDIVQAMLAEKDAEMARVRGLIRRYVAAVGDAEGTDFINDSTHLSKADCDELLAIAPRWKEPKP